MLSSTHQEFASMDAEENAAIEDYNYEQAMFIHNAKNQMQNTNIEDATKHYEAQLQAYKEKFEKILEEKKAENQRVFEEAVDAARARLKDRINDLAAAQQQELRDLEDRWREARDFQKAQIAKTVETLLTSSQFLARSQKFHEAIEMRDKARALEKRKKHPQVEECDAEYNAQFQEMLMRHEAALNELVEQHEELIGLLNDKREAADKAAEAECSIDNAYGTVEIMDMALCDEDHPETAIPVVQHFSPRALRGRRPPVSEIDENGEEEDNKE